MKKETVTSSKAVSIRIPSILLKYIVELNALQKKQGSQLTISITITDIMEMAVKKDWYKDRLYNNFPFFLMDRNIKKSVRMPLELYRKIESVRNWHNEREISYFEEGFRAKLRIELTANDAAILLLTYVVKMLTDIKKIPKLV